MNRIINAATRAEGAESMARQLSKTLEKPFWGFTLSQKMFAKNFQL